MLTCRRRRMKKFPMSSSAITYGKQHNTDISLMTQTNHPEDHQISVISGRSTMTTDIDGSRRQRLDSAAGRIHPVTDDVGLAERHQPRSDIPRRWPTEPNVFVVSSRPSRCPICYYSVDSSGSPSCRCNVNRADFHRSTHSLAYGYDNHSTETVDVNSQLGGRHQTRTRDDNNIWNVEESRQSPQPSSPLPRDFTLQSTAFLSADRRTPSPPPVTRWIVMSA